MVLSVGVGTLNSHMVVGVRCIIAGTSGCGVVNGALSTAVKVGYSHVDEYQWYYERFWILHDAKIYYTGGSIAV
jgi:hypothetical protein